jgi:hypothetical protein
MAKSALKTFTDAITGGKGVKDERAFDPKEYPRVIETARGLADVDALIEAGIAKMPPLEAALASAKARIEVARVRLAEGSGTKAELATEKRAVDDAIDALEGQTGVNDALKSKRARLSEEHRRAEHEAEGEACAAVRADVEQCLREQRWHVTGEGEPSQRPLQEITRRLEQLGTYAEKLTAWGSPGAARHGYFCGMGEHGRSITSGRGLPPGGAHTLNACVLPDERGNSAWNELLREAALAGLEV